MSRHSASSRATSPQATARRPTASESLHHSSASRFVYCARARPVAASITALVTASSARSGVKAFSLTAITGVIHSGVDGADSHVDGPAVQHGTAVRPLRFSYSCSVKVL